MRRTLMIAALLIIGFVLTFGPAGCSSMGSKAAKRKVKMATPGVDAKGEDALKRVKEETD